MRRMARVPTARADTARSADRPGSLETATPGSPRPRAHDQPGVLEQSQRTQLPEARMPLSMRLGLTTAVNHPRREERR